MEEFPLSRNGSLIMEDVPLLKCHKSVKQVFCPLMKRGFKFNIHPCKC